VYFIYFHSFVNLNDVILVDVSSTELSWIPTISRPWLLSYCKFFSQIYNYTDPKSQTSIWAGKYSFLCRILKEVMTLSFRVSIQIQRFS